MKIRSITLFASLGVPLDAGVVADLGETARAARQTFEAAGYEVQTLRLATNLFPALLAAQKAAGIPGTVAAIEARCRDAGFEFTALGPAGAEAAPWIPDILGATESIFATISLTDFETGRIQGSATRNAARTIHEAANIAEGFGNLRFAALANVGPGTPFFPAAYWTEPAPAFAIATEAADLALAACRSAADPADVHARLCNAVTRHGQGLGEIGRTIAHQHGIRFLGIDFSPAPYPSAPEKTGAACIGAALEALTGAPLGAAGTLAAAALLTDAIQKADFPHVGFCGLMMPVLEDTILAQRAAEGRLHISDLLQWSAVCGTGLDTVPVPGDTSEAALCALLTDVAALAIRLNKPLTARLMPLPGKRAGDPVHFDFAYFADGGVLPMPGDGTPHAEHGCLGQIETLTLSAIASRHD